MDVEKELKEIKERNRRVEQDKAWETSKTRKGIIFIATYVIFAWFLLLINAPSPYLNALVPAVAFILSTLTLPFIKKFWAGKVYKK